MSTAQFKIVGLGELLWDVLPTGKHLGGAPANFAYISTLLGDQGIVASRTGDDVLGREATGQLRSLEIDTSYIQLDQLHPTGTVQVAVDPAGQPRFEIEQNVAWDFLEWAADWERLASQADAICFGSLAQRSERSRATIQQFLATASPKAIRVFDVNLRQAYYSAEILAASMKLAHIVKMNDEELPRIMELTGLPDQDEILSAHALVQRYCLRLICVTRGPRGSLLVSDQSQHEHGGLKIRVADTVGAGDAFTAGLVHEYLRGSSLPGMNETANRVGAWVASQTGGMPRAPESGLWAELSNVLRVAGA